MYYIICTASHKASQCPLFARLLGLVVLALRSYIKNTYPIDRCFLYSEAVEMARIELACKKEIFKRLHI